MTSVASWTRLGKDSFEGKFPGHLSLTVLMRHAQQKTGELFAFHKKRYGVRRIRAEPQRSGVQVSDKRVHAPATTIST
jgi:hypothetical protein